MKKVIYIIISIILILLLILFSPTIITYITTFIKSINKPIITESIGTVNWLMFYGTIFGGICTLFAFILSYMTGKKQIENQHKESVRAIIHQDEMNNISDVNKSLADLIQAFNSNDQIRNIYKMIFDRKYSDAYATIEKVRNTIVFNRNNFFLISDIKQLESNSDCTKCKLNKFDYCKNYKKSKKELDKVIEDLENMYMDILEKLQDVVESLHNNSRVNKSINSTREIVVVAKRLNKALEINKTQQNLLEIEDNNKKIKVKESEIKMLKKNLIPQEEINNCIERLNASMEYFNKEITNKMSKLLSSSKEYLELKKIIATEKIK